MRKKSLPLMFLMLVIAATPLRSEVTLTPVATINLNGGQYWVSGSEPATFAGNADVYFAPVINFSPSTALLPIFTGLYSGTKDVRELVGGGTLTREMQDHSLALKFVHKYSATLKLKARAGYKLEYVKETRDETWGKGLFDYQKPILGIEAEKTWPEWRGRAGMDYYTMHYPNYQSLVSQSEFETSIDTTTYTEISTQAGTDVLDCQAVSVFLEGTKKLSDTSAGFARYDLTVKNFADQRVVGNTGAFSGTKRADAAHLLTLGLSMSAPRVSLGCSDVVQYYDSNQNSFDMANSAYIAGYYDFIENTFAPNITFKLGNAEQPVRLSLFWELAWRQYIERLAQYDDASYKTEKVTQVFNTTGCGIVYPLSRSLSAKMTVSYRDSVSNMRYEKNYRYNYYNFNYFCGITWEL